MIDYDQLTDLSGLDALEGYSYFKICDSQYMLPNGVIHSHHQGTTSPSSIWGYVASGQYPIPYTLPYTHQYVSYFGRRCFGRLF